MNKWIIYESEKKKLQAKYLTPEQYEKAIKELCKKIGV